MLEDKRNINCDNLHNNAMLGRKSHFAVLVVMVIQKNHNPFFPDIGESSKPNHSSTNIVREDLSKINLFDCTSVSIIIK